MNPTCVVHLTPTTGSMQASARIARFVAAELAMPLVDDLTSLREFTRRFAGHHYNVIMVNGPIAFCGMRDELGDELLPFVERLMWIQNDYTITLPPHKSYSRPTKADTPFRKQFHSIPFVSTWTTCKDTLEWRAMHVNLGGGHLWDKYINWNALTYAPYTGGDQPIYERLCYYGALREGRKASLARLLRGVDCDISVSRSTDALITEWRNLLPSAVCYPTQKNTLEWEPRKVTNGNHWGDQPLLPWIANYRHSLYVADMASCVDFHSLANRFYEVLSTPHTILWLDAAGADTYEEAGLSGWEAFAVEDDVQLNAKLKKAKKLGYATLAGMQRNAWVKRDPFKLLRKGLQAAYTEWTTWGA